MPENDFNFSPSAAAVWEQCPRRWWHRYIDRLPEPPPGEPAILGTFVHQILEMLLDEPALTRNAETARKFAASIWPSIAASEEWLSLELDDRAALRFRKRAWTTVEAYFSMIEPAEVEPIAQELEVRVELDGVPFRGFIDLVEREPINGSVVVTDYKTGAPPVQGKPWSEELEREKLWQPLWYAAALSELGDYVPSSARLLYFTATESSDRRHLIPRTRELAVGVNDNSLLGARDELRRRWDDIAVARERGEAKANPGPLCGWCPFVEMCPEGDAEVRRRWNEVNPYSGERRIRADAPAVAVLGLEQ
ncbi:MAG TPA: PD-(D/E)XK nuclease family protein [Microthrixaceae bacterium]|nr:PD-(D/E)XK nuclease family protein [Microthrixaceae bacterium]